MELDKMKCPEFNGLPEMGCDFNTGHTGIKVFVIGSGFGGVGEKFEALQAELARIEAEHGPVFFIDTDLPEYTIRLAASMHLTPEQISQIVGRSAYRRPYSERPDELKNRIAVSFDTSNEVVPGQIGINAFDKLSKNLNRFIPIEPKIKVTKPVRHTPAPYDRLGKYKKRQR